MLDAHHHFWKISRGDYDWMSPAQGVLLRDYGPDDLQPLIGAAGVTRTVVIQAAETEAETDYLLELAARTDFVAGVVGWIDMFAENFGERLAHYRRQPKWVGLRPLLQEHDASVMRDPLFRRNLALVARQGVPFDLCIFRHQLPEAVAALRATPGLRAIVDHIAKPDMTGGRLEASWAQGIDQLAAMPGVHCKISGLVTEAGSDWSEERIRPFVEHVAAAFGPDRLVFGSDWPVCKLAASYRQVFDLARSLLGGLYTPQQVEAIMQANGERFYGLAD